MKQESKRNVFLSAVVLFAVLGLVGCASDQLTSWTSLVEGVEGKMGARQEERQGEASGHESQDNNSQVTVIYDEVPDMTKPLSDGDVAECPSCSAPLEPLQDAGAQGKLKCTACGRVFTLTPTDAESASSEETEKPQEP